MRQLLVYFALLILTGVGLYVCLYDFRTASDIKRLRYESFGFPVMYVEADLEGDELTIWVERLYANDLGYAWGMPVDWPDMDNSADEIEAFYEANVFGHRDRISARLTTDQRSRINSLLDYHDIWNFSEKPSSIQDGKVETFFIESERESRTIHINNVPTLLVDEFESLLVEIANEWVNTGIEINTDN